MGLKEQLTEWVSNIKEQNMIKSGKIDNPIIPEMVFDALFYYQQFKLRP